MLEVKRDRLIKGYEREGFTQRQINNRLKKVELMEESEKNQKPVKEMVITIEWKKSQTWGSCPNASARIQYQDNTWNNITGYKASGCGYDKESTVIANICNDTLKYLLWNQEYRTGAPYGIRFDDEYNHSFEGGVGTSCYYNIIEFFGGEMKRIASGNTFDVYRISFEGVC